MSKNQNSKTQFPDDMKACLEFHGHLCPGLVYGYLVAKSAVERLELKRSIDEEVVAVCENDSCAIDALQIILGTSAGKGNLILKDYGKNAYTIINRTSRKAYRYARMKTYQYKGDCKQEFERLDAAISAGTASDDQKRRQKFLKAADLISRPIDDVFTVREVACHMPPLAPLAPSKACAKCGEMTMSTKMRTSDTGQLLCKPCFGKDW